MAFFLKVFISNEENGFFMDFLVSRNFFRNDFDAMEMVFVYKPSN